MDKKAELKESRTLEVNTKKIAQNAISTKLVSYFGIKNLKYDNDINHKVISRKKEEIFILINETGFVPNHKTVYRNIPFDLNCKLIELLVFPRYRESFVRGYLDSISHINSITFKLVTEKILDAIEQTERRLNLDVLTPASISYDMFLDVRSASLKQYLHRFVIYSHSLEKGDSNEKVD
ncbi:hypothetical protein HGO21_03410 [Acinetobacter sp. CUI P1]|nr:hypothetical protein [Acinetobacter sp. CUI P1]